MVDVHGDRHFCTTCTADEVRGDPLERDERIVHLGMVDDQRYVHFFGCIDERPQVRRVRGVDAAHSVTVPRRVGQHLFQVDKHVGLLGQADLALEAHQSSTIARSCRADITVI